MSIATYSDLQGSIANWVKRSDLTSLIPDFIALAESRIARDLRLRLQVVTASLTCVPSSQTVALPSDFLEFENLTLVGNPNRTLSVVTPEILDKRYPENYGASTPVVYCVVGNNIRLGPTPDAAYTVSIDYYQRFSHLSSSPTNWLLTNYPMVYLAPSLVEAFLYVFDDQNAAKWEARYQSEVASLQDKDDQAVRSGSAMRVRAL